MKEENDELLLKEDLCARFPYGVKLEIKHQNGAWMLFAIYYAWSKIYVIGDGGYPIESNFADCKPYLFPLSSMTDEQEEELKYLCDWENDRWRGLVVIQEGEFCMNTEIINWLNENHFDYNGLIEKGLAIDASGLNIY